ncbi:MAG: GNAT family N-acetyltransferase [Candidatus Brocadiaceae bacterium]|uniref:GNAT family N-acetyltransferase n=1 Tax=Candidatus Wunengus sp. YC61 TaxID=3367698 RepID=UPI00271C09EF|nr:GNAT family N-acetyltransferase [Candidatus Brocadiaceae bacterium]
MNYCKANLLDLLAIEQLEKDCFPTEAFNRHLIKNLLTNTKSVIIKATEPSGEIIGTIIGTTKRENCISVGRIFSLCVLDEYRKKGIATRLVLLLEEEFSLRGIKKIRLEVSTHNNIARMFYERQGYQMTPHILPHFYNNGTNAFVLNKRLPYLSK